MDSLLKEIRKMREAYAAEFGYDLRAIHCDLKQQEQASGRRIVSLPPRRPKRVGPRSEKRKAGVAWESVREEFALEDGSLRDILILGTDLTSWQRMLDRLRTAGYDLEYFCDNQPSELPANVSEAFPLSLERNRRLSVRFAGVLANCHFFTPEVIEFDIDTREIRGQEQLDAVFEFMRCLADAVGKEAILTPENCLETVIFRIRPGDSAVEHRTFGGAA